MTRQSIRKFYKPLYPLLDVIMSPFTLLASLLLFSIRKIRIVNMPVSKAIFRKVGVFPITNHYNEPLFDHRLLKLPFDRDRFLPGVKWNDQEQLGLLEKFQFKEELAGIPFRKEKEDSNFDYDNPSFPPGDAEYLYCMVRHFKPARIIEIRSGYSTLMVQRAINGNRQWDPGCLTEHICIEPDKKPWLEKTGARIITQRVEDVQPDFFKSLEENDFLFIDSSHVVRSQGDVLYEFLEILPGLRKGVIIHVRDIYSPKDYPEKLLVSDGMFWNEQYILEAFLTCNQDFEIIGSLNYLKSQYPQQMFSKLPGLGKMKDEVPGSFWMRKVN